MSNRQAGQIVFRVRWKNNIPTLQSGKIVKDQKRIRTMRVMTKHASKPLPEIDWSDNIKDAISENIRIHMHLDGRQPFFNAGSVVKLLRLYCNLKKRGFIRMDGA